MATQAQYKARGIVMLVTFFAVLVAIFLPIYHHANRGKINGLDYLDTFFNELSKGSSYHINTQLEKAKKYVGTSLSTTMKMKSADDAATVATLLSTNGQTATVEGNNVKVQGDFGNMLTAMLKDADLMFKNDGAAVSKEYGGMDARKALLGWYNALGAMDKDMTKDKKFEKAQVVQSAMTKAVEPAYNYYGVQSKSVKDELGLLIAALVFYLVYTVWYGFGLLYMFEGMGIKLEH